LTEDNSSAIFEDLYADEDMFDPASNLLLPISYSKGSAINLKQNKTIAIFLNSLYDMALF
jgi:hypothetical protein